MYAEMNLSMPNSIFNLIKKQKLFNLIKKNKKLKIFYHLSVFWKSYGMAYGGGLYPAADFTYNCHKITRQLLLSVEVTNTPTRSEQPNKTGQ